MKTNLSCPTTKRVGPRDLHPLSPAEALESAASTLLDLEGQVDQVFLNVALGR